MKKIITKFFVPVLLMGLIVAVFLMAGGPAWVQTNIGGLFKPASISNLPSETIGTCPQDPTFTLSAVSELYPSTSVTGTYNAKVNGGNIQVITSSTKFKKGDKLALFVNASGYIAKVIYPESSPYVVDCGVNPLSIKLLDNTAVPTIKVVGDNGLQLTELGVAGTNNDTGGTTTLSETLKIVPDQYKGVGDVVLVIEANSSTKIQSISTNYPTTGLPNSWKATTTLGRATAFLISGPILSSKDVQVQLKPASGQNTQQVIVNASLYFAQAWKDIDGSIKTSLVEQSDGTAVYNNMTSYAWATN